jgi:hypothetical protein
MDFCFVAQTGPPAMSAVRSLTGVNRTSHREPILIATDPQTEMMTEIKPFHPAP